MNTPSTWHSPLWQAGPYRAWLTDHGSLTRRLQARCPRFAVERLRQGIARPHTDECAALGLAHHRLAMVREVLLLCAGRPVVFAHSVVALAGLRGPWVGLSGLGNKPLGAALFADPLVVRHPLEFCRLDARHPLYRAAAVHLAGAPRFLWARRSRFEKAGSPILVTEVFLPEVLCLP
ncbi:chorismate--pyruvate lyase family protein [Sulfuritortus calidifontis]|nr:chorismate lyase [Sulfuritortus calidifontis]